MVTHKKVQHLLILLFITFLGFGNAQILNPIKFTSETKKLSDDEFEVLVKVKLDKGWHLFSTQHQDGGIGIPTSFEFKKNNDTQLVGSIKEVGKLHDEYVEMFEEQQKFYENEVVFIQKVKALKNTTLEVEVTTQVCDDSRCLPPDYKTFTFQLNPTVKETSKPVENTDQSATPPQKDKGENGDEDSNDEKDNSVKVNSDSVAQATGVAQAVNANSQNTQTQKKSATTKSINKPNPKKGKRSLWEIFVFGFLGGFAALLMPCIYPMIPLTVSLFTKQSENKGSGIAKAFLYGLSIIVIYVTLGMLITAIFGPSALNEMATNPWVNIAFFILFFLFAISFFGGFEITLPSKWINKADKGADKGGFIGIFFMALTLALVSFSCTGPIIGSLIVESANTGAKMGPAIGMFGFALALAIPFTLFAIFPSWMNKLPKSGGWLNNVKVSLGFIELAFAMKFLSNADLVWQAHILEREVFIAAWVGIFFVMGLYLLNVFRMSLDSKTEHIGVTRLLFALFTFLFVFYMLPGIWGAPLKILSGLIPPKNYSESPNGFFPSTSALQSNTALPANAHYGPHQIPSFYDIDDAFSYAEQVNKPVMIDFTGDACANCRKVEDNVWSDPRVSEKLANEVVLASLYVDRRTELPKDQQVYSEAKERKLKTIGDKWSQYQIDNFKSNSQPLYVIVDKDLNRYNLPIGYESDIETYLQWMDEGIENFKNKTPVELNPNP